METDNEFEKIDLFAILRRFFKSLKKLWLLVLLLAVLLGSLNYIRAKRSYTPMYESRATFSVSSGYYANDIFSSSYYYDNSAAKELAAAFPHLLGTDMMQDLMKEHLGKTYINGSITATSVADTNMFELKVRSSSAQDAYDILCAVIDCYPQVAMIMVDNPQAVIRREPTLPTAPYNSFSGTSSLVKGILMGLLLGLGIVLINALLNKTLLTPEDVKTSINLPLLAVVPHVNAKNQKPRNHSFIQPSDDFGLAEALRSLRTKVHKILGNGSGKVIMITSTVPGEGKSTIASNLALSLASEGCRVVLLDADLRNQTIAHIFGNDKPRKGLMDCLKDPRLPASSCLHKAPNSNLYYLSGNSTTNRHYNIDARALRRVLDELSPHFDYIIVDSPPCGIISDTALLGRAADSILFVIKRDYANCNQILEAVTGLHERDLPLSGCVFNDAPRSYARQRYGHGYGYKYGQQDNE